MMLMTQIYDHLPGAFRWCFLELARAIIPASDGPDAIPVRDADADDAAPAETDDGDADAYLCRQSYFVR